MGAFHMPEAEPPLIIRPHPAPVQSNLARRKTKETRSSELSGPLGRPPPPTNDTKVLDSAPVSTQPPHYPPANTAPSHHQGPVRGKPRIFSAMAATSEVGDIEPQVVEMIGNVSLEAKAVEGYSAYAYSGQQTSTPPPEPTPEPVTAPSQRRKLSKSSQQSSRKAVEAPLASDSHDRRRLSTTAPSTPMEQQNPSRHHSRRESTAVLDSRSREQEPSSRHGSHAGSQSRRESMSHERKLQKRSRDGVKMLTDKQMEKLNQRKSYHGTAVPQDLGPAAEPSRKSYVEDHTSGRPVSQYQTNRRSSQAYTAPLPAPAPHHPEPSQKPLPSQPQFVPPAHATSSNWSDSIQKMATPIQLPTPPDEHIPAQQRHREASAQKVKRISPKYIEDMEVFAGPGRPNATSATEDYYYPLLAHLSQSALLENLLAHLAYYEWLTLASVSRDIRKALYEDGREQVLARYLQTVGYCTWGWKDPEPLILTVHVSWQTKSRIVRSADHSIGPLSLHAWRIHTSAPLRCYSTWLAQTKSDG